MQNFFRVQTKNISFEEMKNYNSQGSEADGVDEGLAVSSSPNGYDGGSRFGGAYDAMDDDDDLVILQGDIVAPIYDGYKIRPTKEIARFTIEQWEAMLEDGSAYEYEI